MRSCWTSWVRTGGDPHRSSSRPRPLRRRRKRNTKPDRRRAPSKPECSSPSRLPSVRGLRQRHGGTSVWTTSHPSRTPTLRKDGSQVPQVGSVPRLRLLVQLINGVPGPGESTHLVVPGMRALLQRLQIHLGEVFRPIRDVNRARSSDPAARKDADLSDPFAHHPAQDRELHLRVLACQGPRHLSSSRQSPRLGMVGGLSGLSASGRAAFDMGIPVRSGRSDRRAAGKGFLPSEMSALAGCPRTSTGRARSRPGRSQAYWGCSGTATPCERSEKSGSLCHFCKRGPRNKAQNQTRLEGWETTRGAS